MVKLYHDSVICGVLQGGIWGAKRNIPLIVCSIKSGYDTVYNNLQNPVQRILWPFSHL